MYGIICYYHVDLTAAAVLGYQDMVLPLQNCADHIQSLQS